MKYTDTLIGFREFPDEIALLVNISGCPIHCNECHSPELWEDIGKELNKESIDKLIKENEGITLFAFMGGISVDYFAKYIKDNYPHLKVGWYTGQSTFFGDSKNYDYVKLGPYIKDLGPLDNPNTNQRMYKYDSSCKDSIEGLGEGWIDITHKFYDKRD